MKSRHSHEQGAVPALLISTIALAVVVIGVVALAIWLYVNYSDAKTNVDSKVAVAEAEAKRSQAEADEIKFAERDKQPNREFVGPDDYGRVTFSYPKTWSVYVARDIDKGGDYEAYLNPVLVPPVSSSQRYALRVVIETKEYDRVVSAYDSKVKKGELKTSPYSVNGTVGTRLDGTFNNDIRGAVVIFKLRDKTVSIFTDANTFKPDFEKIIKTIDFNS